MKRRIGFVSNSSGSSFIIAKSSLTRAQLKAIREHDRYLKRMTPTMKFAFLAEKDRLDIEVFKTGMAIPDDSWDVSHDAWLIKENDEFIVGITNMDNFDMLSFLKAAGVKKRDMYSEEEMHVGFIEAWADKMLEDGKKLLPGD